MVAKCHGRSLVELICVIFIISIITAIALPNLQELRDRNTRAQTTNQMVSLLHHARSNAVFSRKIVSICSGVERCSDNTRWQNALLIFIDRNANGQLDSDDELLLRANITDEFYWHWNRTKGHIQFETDGTTRAMNGTLTLCRKGTPEHQIVVALAGRTRGQHPSHGAKC
jgi:type IV fimbrial biogenesis protein FimT